MMTSKKLDRRQSLTNKLSRSESAQAEHVDDFEPMLKQSLSGQEKLDKGESSAKGVSMLAKLVRRNTLKTDLETKGINKPCESTTIVELQTLPGHGSTSVQVDRSGGPDIDEMGPKPILRRRSTSRIEMTLARHPKQKLERKNTSIVELKCIDIHRSKLNIIDSPNGDQGENSPSAKIEPGLSNFEDMPESARSKFKLLRRNSNQTEMEIRRSQEPTSQPEDTIISEIDGLDKSHLGEKWKGKMGKLGTLEGGNLDMSKEQKTHEEEREKPLEPWLPVLAMKKMLRQFGDQVTAHPLQTFQIRLQLCKSMCCLQSGDIVVSGTLDRQDPQPNTYEIHWYQKNGTFHKKIPHPGNCRHYSIGVLELQIEGTFYIVMSCYICKAINLYNIETGIFTEAFSSTEVSPGQMCIGGPNELCATNKKKLVVFDTATTEFTIKHELDPGSRAEFLSYIGQHEIGGILITTDGCPFYKVYGRKLETGDLLYSHGGKDEKGADQKVAGKYWRPFGICTDGTHVYIADMKNKRVIIFNGVTGKITQTLTPGNVEKVVDTCWYEEQGHLVVQHELRDMCFISFFELE